ncbi:hypothetical protein MRB53_015728 [Persea americana]|uniref:Uncharacterized protein n=1 Tax=Persea americana TaxID=3435 RepID=A0ACC2M0A8_PERAE|nr:hypothetical protein MRB53_015728 [Persea americana]
MKGLLTCLSVPNDGYNNCSTPMIHDGDESFEVEKVDNSKMAKNFKTLDERMGSGNGMKWNDDCGELGAPPVSLLLLTSSSSHLLLRK